jgi:DNA invertase Pin-like site-specific DNA recombinase
MRQGLNYLRVSSRRQVDKGFDEDGLSLPAQREACARYANEHAITIAGEYIERGESARTADRPAFQAMLARIQQERDVQVVVVHKVDRFARNLEDHVTVRALLRRLGVELVSVVEPLDDSPQGRLTEGIHALMAEFYSANLAAEIRKGMTQKAKQGGWPHQAPLGYRNVRKPIGGRLVACIEPDPDRAHHIPADRLERQVEQLYERIQLPHPWLTELQSALEAEINARQGQAAHELQQLDRELLGLDGERRKLLEAYYADAIDLPLLRQEQTRISQRTSTLEARRRSLAANLDDWRVILETASRFATNCGAAYRHADPRTRKLFNNAVIDRIEIRDGHIAHVDYQAPFDLLFSGSGFEYRTVVELRGFEPLTPCMPSMRGRFTTPCRTSCAHIR